MGLSKAMHVLDRAQALTQNRVNLLPESCPAPGSLIMINGLPLREPVRQQPPCTATSEEVKERVYYLAHVGRARATSGLSRRYKGSEQRPLFISQITIISFAIHSQSLRNPAFQTPSSTTVVDRSVLSVYSDNAWLLPDVCAAIATS